MRMSRKASSASAPRKMKNHGYQPQWMLVCAVIAIDMKNDPDDPEGSILYLYHAQVLVALSDKVEGYKQMPDGLIRVVGVKLK